MTLQNVFNPAPSPSPSALGLSITFGVLGWMVICCVGYWCCCRQQQQQPQTTGNVRANILSSLSPSINNNDANSIPVAVLSNEHGKKVPTATVASDL